MTTELKLDCVHSDTNILVAQENEWKQPSTVIIYEGAEYIQRAEWLDSTSGRNGRSLNWLLYKACKVQSNNGAERMLQNNQVGEQV